MDIWIFFKGRNIRKVEFEGVSLTTTFPKGKPFL